MKIVFLATSGGHLFELSQLKKALVDHDITVITSRDPFGSKSHGDKQVHYIKRIRKSLLCYSFFYNFIKSICILLKRWPYVIITTGDRSVVPSCFAAKLFRIKLIFIESYARVESRSLTGKVISRIADNVFVQWEECVKKYKNAKYFGALLEFDSINISEAKYDFFITTGLSRSFERLLKAVDELVEDGTVSGNIMAQIGQSRYTPKHFPFVRCFNPDEYQKVISQTRTVVSHAGVGTVLSALKYGRKLIVLPRDPDTDYVIDYHQHEWSNSLSRNIDITLCDDISTLGACFATSEQDTVPGRQLKINKSELIQEIKRVLKINSNVLNT